MDVVIITAVVIMSLYKIALATENNDGQREMNSINWRFKNFAESWDWK